MEYEEEENEGGTGMREGRGTRDEAREKDEVTQRD
jgi:hypothetical protein